MSATEQLALEQGIEAVTMLDVGKLAGVSAGTLYQYYAGLEPLLAAWEEERFEEMARACVTRVQEIASEAPPPEQSIAELIGFGFDLMTKHMGYFRDVEKTELTSRVVARVRVGDGVVDSLSKIFASGPIATTYSTRRPPEAVAVTRRELQTMVVSYLLRDV